MGDGLKSIYKHLANGQEHVNFYGFVSEQDQKPQAADKKSEKLAGYVDEFVDLLRLATNESSDNQAKAAAWLEGHPVYGQLLTLAKQRYDEFLIAANDPRTQLETALAGFGSAPELPNDNPWNYADAQGGHGTQEIKPLSARYLLLTGTQVIRHALRDTPPVYSAPYLGGMTPITMDQALGFSYSDSLLMGLGIYGLNAPGLEALEYQLIARAAEMERAGFIEAEIKKDKDAYSRNVNSYQKFLTEGVRSLAIRHTYDAGLKAIEVYRKLLKIGKKGEAHAWNHIAELTLSAGMKLYERHFSKTRSLNSIIDQNAEKIQIVLRSVARDHATLFAEKSPPRSSEPKRSVSQDRSDQLSIIVNHFADAFNKELEKLLAQTSPSFKEWLRLGSSALIIYQQLLKAGRKDEAHGWHHQAASLLITADWLYRTEQNRKVGDPSGKMLAELLEKVERDRTIHFSSPTRSTPRAAAGQPAPRATPRLDLGKLFMDIVGDYRNASANPSEPSDPLDPSGPKKPKAALESLVIGDPTQGAKVVALSPQQAKLGIRDLDSDFISGGRNVQVAYKLHNQGDARPAQRASYRRATPRKLRAVRARTQNRVHHTRLASARRFRQSHLRARTARQAVRS